MKYCKINDNLTGDTYLYQMRLTHLGTGRGKVHISKWRAELPTERR